MNKIGFYWEDDEEYMEELEVGTSHIVESSPDLNTDIVETINSLITSLHRYGGQISGLTIDVDDTGNYTAKIKYNSGRREA